MTEFSNCPTCGRSKRDCDEAAAKGWDACCMTCDEIGRAPNHRVLTVGDWDLRPCRECGHYAGVHPTSIKGCAACEREGRVCGQDGNTATHPTSPSAQCRGEGRGGAVSEGEGL